jgi:hypothetical protein
LRPSRGNPVPPGAGEALGISPPPTGGGSRSRIPTEVASYALVRRSHITLKRTREGCARICPRTNPTSTPLRGPVRGAGERRSPNLPREGLKLVREALGIGVSSVPHGLPARPYLFCIGSCRTTREGRWYSRRSPCRRNFVRNFFECERTIPLYI